MESSEDLRLPDDTQITMRLFKPLHIKWCHQVYYGEYPAFEEEGRSKRATFTPTDTEDVQGI